MEKRGYTIPEASKYVGVSTQTLRRHIDAGKLSVKYPSSVPVIDVIELDAWFAALPAEAK